MTMKGLIHQKRNQAFLSINGDRLREERTTTYSPPDLWRPPTATKTLRRCRGTGLQGWQRRKPKGQRAPWVTGCGVVFGPSPRPPCTSASSSLTCKGT
uniref:Uncharacterized protein n=1 Tax=Oryza rufipogon TaxID=4529 RepID=A0A0E0QGI7_ORYRU